jgi:type I restriction enzyme S subunit
VASFFDGLIRAIIERIHANIDLATNLACLRDTLLPRLISGKLRLPEAEAVVETLA